MKAGTLDRRITIQRQGEPYDDGYTTRPGELEDYASRWASWKPANGRETFQNQGVEAVAGGTFWVRWDSLTKAIQTTDVISFEGRVWNIVGVQEIGRREGVELIVVAGD